MYVVKTFGLFVLTAIAEIVGCYLPYLWLKKDGSAWLLVPAALSLALFVWLLTLHPNAAGRIYAAYGGVYIGVAIFWLWIVDAVRPTTTDLIGVAISLFGMGVIILRAQHEGIIRNRGAPRWLSVVATMRGGSQASVIAPLGASQCPHGSWVPGKDADTTGSRIRAERTAPRG